MTSKDYLKGNSFSEFDPELNGKSTCVELITALTAVEMAKREERERLMAHLIDKDAVVAEIEKHLKYATNGIEYAQMGIDKGLGHYKKELAIWQHCQSMCHNILSFIDTLEVKEVDLEKETKKWWKEHLHLDPKNQLWMDAHQSIVFAEHFFELGLKIAQKGEEV